MFIFINGHYSLVYVSSVGARQQFKDPANVTEAEALAVWGPFGAHSGTAELSGGRLTVRPFVAKNPAFMSAGSFWTFSYKLDGKTLWMTDANNVNGPVANPRTWKLVLVE